MKSNMSIRTKLYVTFGIALALTLIVSAIGFTSLKSLEGSVVRLVKVEARKLFLASDVNTRVSDLISLERAMLVRASMNDWNRVAQYQQDYAKTANTLKKNLDELLPLTVTPEGRRLAEFAVETTRTIVENHSELMRQLQERNAAGALETQTGRTLPLAVQLNDAAEQLVVQVNKVAGQEGQKVEQTVTRDSLIMGAAAAFGLLIGLVVVFVVRQIDRSLRQSIIELESNAEQVAAASSQVASSSQALAQGASEQAASLEETSASTQEISSMATGNASMATSAAAVIEEAIQGFAEATKHLDQLVAAMEEIDSAGQQVAKIIKLIDEIAFQTNILALNAAIEAARAGDAGMGFSVVADEVRTLAQRCAGAAQETATLIDASVSKSHTGKIKVDDVAAVVRSLAQGSAQVHQLLQKVDQGSQEQTRGVGQIGKSILQMEQVTQTTAANAEEGAAAAEELNAQSSALRAVVKSLSEMVGV